jgi:hypothetical protein
MAIMAKRKLGRSNSFSGQGALLRVNTVEVNVTRQP